MLFRRRVCKPRLGPHYGCPSMGMRHASATAGSGVPRDRDPYKVLGIKRGVTVEVVREAYLGLCKVHHPDVGGTEESFKRIQWAYEECKVTCAAGGGGGARDGGSDDGADFAAQADARRQARAAQNETDLAALREEFREQFEVAEDADLIDALLEEALLSGCFARQEVTEPLMMALQRYHLGLDLGADHAQRCFNAMDTWERQTGRQVHPMFFHTLLTLYSNQAFSHESDSMTVSETVNVIMDHMAVKGLPHDDWTIMIANRVFRAVPYPDW